MTAKHPSHRALRGRPDFLAHPIVQAYVSLRAFGLLARHLDAVVAEIRSRTAPGASILALAAGSGDRERAMATALADRTFIAVLTDPRHAATSERSGPANLRWQPMTEGRLPVADAGADAVTALWALSRVEPLETLWAEIRRVATPGAPVLVQDYVGPARLRWSPAQVDAANRVLADLPEQHTPHHRVVDESLMAELRDADPGLALRSDEIVATCRAAGLSIVGEASAGGALLQPVLTGQIDSYDAADWQHNAILSGLFKEESRLMDAGVIADAIGMFVATT